MKNRRLIYDMLVAQKYVELRHPLSREQAIRKANIYAVENTNIVFNMQHHDSTRGLKPSLIIFDELKDIK